MELATFKNSSKPTIEHVEYIFNFNEVQIEMDGVLISICDTDLDTSRMSVRAACNHMSTSAKKLVYATMDGAHAKKKNKKK